jgi:hypothetical protein
MAGSCLPNQLHRMSIHEFISKSHGLIVKSHNSVEMRREARILGISSHGQLFGGTINGAGHESTVYQDGSIGNGIGNTVFLRKTVP